MQHTAGDGAPIFNLKDASGDFIGDLRPQDNEKIIVKQAPSSFTGTDLHETLQKLKTKQVVLTGYMAHGEMARSRPEPRVRAHPERHFAVCVTGTARSAMEHQYDTVIVKDAIGDRDVPSADGKSVVEAKTLVDVVCHELADAIGTVVHTSDVKA